MKMGNAVSDTTSEVEAPMMNEDAPSFCSSLQVLYFTSLGKNYSNNQSLGEELEPDFECQSGECLLQEVRIAGSFVQMSALRVQLFHLGDWYAALHGRHDLQTSF